MEMNATHSADNTSSPASLILAQIPPISIKLSDGNFLMWKQQIEAAVWGYGLESYLTGEEPAPPSMVTVQNQSVPNPEYIAWRRQDRRLSAWILSSLSESTLVLVVGLKSAKEIWDALEKNYASQSKAKIMQYKMQIQTTRKESQPMKEYLSKMKTCCDLLGSAGCLISEEDQILHILGGLGSYYNPVMVAISSRIEPWTVQEVCSLLHSFETRLEGTSSSGGSLEGSQPTLNVVQQSGQQQTPHGKDFAPQSNRGGFGGAGRGRSGRGGRGGRSHGKVICQLCEKPGHVASKCWHRFEQSFAPQPQQYRPQHTQHGYSPNPSAHMVQVRPQSFGSTQSFVAPSEYSYDGSSSTSWYPDTGATHHISNDLSNLSVSSEYSGGKKLLLGNGLGIDIARVGQGHIRSDSPVFYNKKLLLKNLLHVPEITKNLLSVSQFASDNSVFFEFHPNFCLVKDQATKQIVLKGTLDKGLYHFIVKNPSADSTTSANFPFNQAGSPTAYSASLQPSSSNSKNSLESSLALWHQRLGHPSLDTVKTVLNGCNIPFESMKNEFLCHPCCISKSHRLPFTLFQTSYSAPLELIHSDLWGPSPVTSRNGYSYYVSFIDSYSRYSWIYVLKHKSDVAAVFRQFKSMVETQFSCKIKVLQTDWGGEFQALSTFLKDNGILHRVSCPYTPQQNGVAERKHRHVVEMGLSLLAQSGLPTKFWDDAFITAVFLINLLPTKVLKNISPFEVLFKSKPDYSFLKSFGCLCYPFLRPYNRNKLQFRSITATFLGYSPHHKGYKALLPQGKVIITRDILFDETIFPFKTIGSQKYDSNFFHSPAPIHHSPSSIVYSSPNISPPAAPSPDMSPPPLNFQSDVSQTPSPSIESQSIASSPSPSGPSQDIQQEISPSQDTSPAPTNAPSHHMVTRSKAGIFKPKVFTLTISPYLLPRSALEAILIPYWKAAMLDEFLALLKNKTWILTKLPPGKNLIGCTWVFKIKKHIDGCIARYKARLVAQGFSQQAGFDFNETFSPVVKPCTIRLILSLAVTNGWKITHLDVNNAFLNGNLEEDIYMRQPPGFEQGGPNLVCKLNKAIYGLKQASRAWFLTVLSVLLELGFSQSRADASLFYRNKGAEVTYILIYVDDMLITGNSSSSISRVITQLNDHFSLKDLGEVNLFLGVEVCKTASGLHLSQATYIKDLLKRVNMTGAKGCPTPMVSSCELSKVVGEPLVDEKLYRSTVGALQYATITRPDINFVVNKVSQYMASPLDTHWRAVKRILRYLSGTLDFGIHIQKSNGRITAFSDSDWASDVDDRKSTSGYCTFHGNNLVSWSAKKQSVVARSSTEAEYRSLAYAASEVTWVHSLFGELKIKRDASTVIWVDNLSAIALASNPVLHARTKHIELDAHFVRDKVLAKELELRHVPSSDQLADILTKPLSHQSFVRLRSKLGVIARSALELRGRVENMPSSRSSVDEHGMMIEDEKEIIDCESKGIKMLNMDKVPTQGEDQVHARSWKDVLTGEKRDVL